MPVEIRAVVVDMCCIGANCHCRHWFFGGPPWFFRGKKLKCYSGACGYFKVLNCNLRDVPTEIMEIVVGICRIDPSVISSSLFWGNCPCCYLGGGYKWQFLQDFQKDSQLMAEPFACVKEYGKSETIPLIVSYHCIFPLNLMGVG